MIHTQALKKPVAHGHIKDTWQLQAAKARFSELFRLVRSKGPQWVTRQGKEAVVVLPAEQFERLLKHNAGPQSLVDFFAESPLFGSDVKFKREADFGRDIAL
jgi:prevent-host-death family protein